ncbi:hypothetical protein FH972_021086 [Carpinus fangiana]|uniref:Uncharacterized protein n=1 Tax=Carpinus fangiana TaxID=176857 RepID=A0A5N6KQF8_9ROSI|nr:hypothetical protein FH972_021086 [Carpinus fangiana]
MPRPRLWTNCRWRHTDQTVIVRVMAQSALRVVSVVVDDNEQGWILHHDEVEAFLGSHALGSADNLGSCKALAGSGLGLAEDLGGDGFHVPLALVALERASTGEGAHPEVE